MGRRADRAVFAALVRRLPRAQRRRHRPYGLALDEAPVPGVSIDDDTGVRDCGQIQVVDREAATIVRQSIATSPTSSTASFAVRPGGLVTGELLPGPCSRGNKRPQSICSGRLSADGFCAVGCVVHPRSSAADITEHDGGEPGSAVPAGGRRSNFFAVADLAVARTAPSEFVSLE